MLPFVGFGGWRGGVPVCIALSKRASVEMGGGRLALAFPSFQLSHMILESNHVTAPDAASPVCLNSNVQWRGPGEFIRYAR